jgi:uncharacterized protein YodC (DUF2158 family)
MATKFVKGDVVKLKAVVPQGPVIKFRMDEDTGVVSYLLQWVDVEGHTQERWFAEDELTGA